MENALNDGDDDHRQAAGSPRSPYDNDFPTDATSNFNAEKIVMSKEQKSNKEKKKAPGMTPKEKKAAKKAKKSQKGRIGANGAAHGLFQ